MNVYPMSNYNLLSNNSSSNDLMRVYMDFLVSCDSFRNRNGQLLDFSK